MKKILITGGAGFIGSHIVESLVEKGYRVIVYDNFSSGYKENLDLVKDDVELIEGDILDKNKLSKAMHGVDVVSHHAAQLEIIKCMNSPIDDLQVNTIGTLNVLDTAVKNGVSKFINISSACVYGQAKVVPQKEDEHPLRPNWPYGVSKLAAERYASIYDDNNDIAVTSLRYAIVYGEREWCGRVLTMFLKMALNGKGPVVFGNGDQIRDFTNVHDVCTLHNMCIENSISDGQVYNVSTGMGTKIKDLANIVCEVTNISDSVIFEDVNEGEMSKNIEGRVRLPAELKTMILSNEKARKELNWSPSVNIKDGIKREYEWLKENKQRWEIITI